MNVYVKTLVYMNSTAIKFIMVPFLLINIKQFYLDDGYDNLFILSRRSMSDK